MKILVIGGGGREHALVWKLTQSTRVKHIFVAPGNAGTMQEPRVQNIAIDVTELKQLCQFALDEAIDITIVGPEVPLVAGIVDLFQQHKLKIFGPTQFAAQLEGSKAFAKQFLVQNNIPTAAYAVFSSLQPALDYVRQQGAPIVIKADGLAAGKGVVVAMTIAEAEMALQNLMGEQHLGVTGAQVIIEEFLAGKELSYMVVSDGVRTLPLATSQDYKRRDDGDRGPNTGGMGAYSPVVWVTPELEQYIFTHIIQPTLSGMRAQGHPFVGFLYVGLMVMPQGVVKVLEFNVRLGDPETQPILMRLNSDLLTLIEAALNQQLHQQQLAWDVRCALHVVLAAPGYPEAVRLNDEIQGLEVFDGMSDVKVFHAGTKQIEKQLYTAGGRVLGVCVLNDSIEIAREQAYQKLARITCADSFYRMDIGASGKYAK